MCLKNRFSAFNIGVTKLSHSTVPSTETSAQTRVEKSKRGLGDQVDNLVSGKEIAGVEIDPTIAFPDDNLPDRGLGD